jgi:hypothetical protein
MESEQKQKKILFAGLVVLVLGVGFLSYRLLLVRAASGIDPWVLGLQQPIENRLKWENGGGWNQYTSRYQSVAFWYSLFDDEVIESDSGISLTQSKKPDSVVSNQSVTLKTLDNKYRLNPLHWWLSNQMLRWDWGILLQSRWKMVNSEDGRPQLVVVGPARWDDQQYVYSYFPCGQRMCEVRTLAHRDKYAETVYRRLLMTADGWQSDALGFNPTEWDQRYENTLAGYALRYPGFDVDKSVRAPERDQDDATLIDRVVRLPSQIGMTISATFCSIPGLQYDDMDIETYLQEVPRAGFRERWSIKVPGSDWAQAVRIVGRDALSGQHTYQVERVTPDEAVYIKRDGLLLIITLDGLGRKDLFDAIVNEIELLPLENLTELTGDEACGMHQQDMDDTVGSYWSNKYVVMYIHRGQEPGEETRLPGVSPENFENLDHGWGRQTENGWILCRGKRNYMEYTSFRMADPEKGMAENDHGKYQCSETGFAE